MPDTHLGGSNLVQDVRTVQHLLNRAQARLRAAKFPFGAFVFLAEDGVVGTRTISAIKLFQRNAMSSLHPDGRVDPGGRTLRLLDSTAAGHIPPVPGGGGVLSASSSASELATSPHIKAMLDVLGFTEGTGTNYGKVVNGLVLKSPYYPDLVGKRNVSVTNFSRHPDILVQVSAALKSTAAGRYQFLIDTWNGLNLPDFSAPNQDVAAVQLMKGRGMIAPLLAGNLDDAVYRGAPEWASLPTENGGGYYGGQPARTIAEIRKVYSAALQTYQRLKAASTQ
jgi:muramidase (phage lysozyme)